MNKGYSSLIILLLLTAIGGLVYFGYTNLQKNKTNLQSSNITQGTPEPSGSPEVCPNETWDFKKEKSLFKTEPIGESDYCSLLDSVDDSMVLIYPANWIPTATQGAYGLNFAGFVSGYGQNRKMELELIISGPYNGGPETNVNIPIEKADTIEECIDQSCNERRRFVRENERVINREVKDLNGKKVLYLVTVSKENNKIKTRYFIKIPLDLKTRSFKSYFKVFEFDKENTDINNDIYKNHQQIVEKIIGSFNRKNSWLL